MLPLTILKACRGQLACHTRVWYQQAALLHGSTKQKSRNNPARESSHLDIVKKLDADVQPCQTPQKTVDNTASLSLSDDVINVLKTTCDGQNRCKHLSDVKSQPSGPLSVISSHVSTVRKLSALHYLDHHRTLPMLPNSPLLRPPCHWDATGVTGQLRPFSMHPQAIVKSSPGWLKPYLQLIRLDRPIGTWLLFLPCTWSISMAAAPGHLPDPVLLALFGTGAFLMRGAGCIINDMWDKDFDAMVARTKDRPLPSGQLSYFQSLCFLGLNLTGALGVLLCLNYHSIMLGFACMGLVVTYPLMKRITYWPQLFLGVCMAWGIPMGWLAASGLHHWHAALPMFTAGVFWTMIYDTIYSHQDKEDDLHVGVKSLPLRLGDEGTKPALTAFATGMVGLLGVTGYMCDQTWPYYCGVGVTSAHLAWQIYTVDLNNGPDCASKFRSNKHLGLLMLSGIILGTLLKPKHDDETQNEAEVADAAQK